MKLQELAKQLAKRAGDLDRSIALQAWLPNIFDGPDKPKTQLVSRPGNFSPRSAYKMIVTDAAGNVTEYPIADVPEALK